MNIMAIITAAGVPTAVTAFCFWLVQRSIRLRDEAEKIERENRQKEMDERERQRKEYEKCQLKMTTATMALAEATAAAVERIPDAHCNGEMHAAMAYAQKIKNEQKDFLMSQAIASLDL